MKRQGRSSLHVGAQVAACVFAVASGACVTATAVRPDQLPALAESAARHPKGWHSVTDLEGKSVTLGQVKSVGVPRPGVTRDEEIFETPFFARIQGADLTLGDARHRSSFPLGDLDRVMVQHIEPGQPTQAGVAMIVAGSVVLAPSAYAVVRGSGWLAGGQGSGIGGKLLAIGLAGVAASAALVVPGIVWIVNDRHVDPRKPDRPAPALELTPGGARLRVVF
jgi:hypothetical protein